jgi:hypothetical protein
MDPSTGWAPLQARKNPPCSNCIYFTHRKTGERRRVSPPSGNGDDEPKRSGTRGMASLLSSMLPQGRCSTREARCPKRLAIERKPRPHARAWPGYRMALAQHSIGLRQPVATGTRNRSHETTRRRWRAARGCPNPRRPIQAPGKGHSIAGPGPWVKRITSMSPSVGVPCWQDTRRPAYLIGERVASCLQTAHALGARHGQPISQAINPKPSPGCRSDPAARAGSGRGRTLFRIRCRGSKIGLLTWEAQ